MKTVSKALMYEFMKWFINKHRESIRYEDNVNAVYFASDLMVRLCSQQPQYGETPMDKEFDEFLTEHPVYIFTKSGNKVRFLSQEPGNNWLVERVDDYKQLIVPRIALIPLEKAAGYGYEV